MKALIRTMTVFVVINLVTAGFAFAEKTAEKEDLEILKKQLEVAKRQVKETAENAKAIAQQAKEAAKKQIEATKVTLLELPFITKTGRHSSCDRVLIIPAAETKAEQFLTITEDMSIMSHILDKKLGKSDNSFDYFFGGSPHIGYGGQGGGYGRSFPFSSPDNLTRAIYLQGYAALFLMKVDFPLSPPVEIQEKEAAEPADATWEEAKRQMYSPDDRSSRSRKRSAEKYDAEKVEDLKMKLVKALKHAANIRNLKPDEWVILSVTEEGRGPGVLTETKFVSRVITVFKGNQIVATEVPSLPSPPSPPSSNEMEFPAPTIMTIRAKSSDVDVFSQGQLDFDQFSERVQIFLY